MAKDGEGINPDVIPPSNAAANRQRAYRISKQIKEGHAASQEDLVWLTEYEKAKQSRHASRSKKVTFSSEETESAATGDLSVAAALAAPQLAREEGRRIDSLIKEATNATSAANKTTIAACELVLKFAGLILDRNGKLEQNNIAMLDTFRKSHVELTHAHAALVQQQAEQEADEITRQAEEAAAAAAEGDKDGINTLVEQFMPYILEGIAARGGVPPSTKKA